MTTFSERIKALRIQRGETLQQTADSAGVSKARLWATEKDPDANPTIFFLRAIAAHFEVPLSQLLDDRPPTGVKEVTLGSEDRKLVLDYQALKPHQRKAVRVTMDAFLRPPTKG